MKSAVIGLTLAVSAFASSCNKKEAGSASLTAGQPFEKARDWYDQQLKTTPALSIQGSPGSKGNFIITSKKPQWDKGHSFSDEGTLIVPMQMSLLPATGNVVTSAYLVMNEITTGDIMNGDIYVVLQQAGPENVVASPRLFRNKIDPGMFSGAIMRYSVAGFLEESHHYKNGIPEVKEDRLSRRVNKTSAESQGIVPLNEGCNYVTIDWYWQTFENGVLINEVFVFSSIEVVCDGTAGGGGSQHESLDDFFERGVAAGHPTSIKTAEETIDIDATHRLKKYDWRFYENKGIGYVHYYSREYGYQEKQINNKWIFTSLIHNSTWKIDNTPNWDVTVTIATATPTLGVGTLANWATMELEYDYVYKFEYMGYTHNRAGRDKSASTWNANQGDVIPLPGE